MKTGTLICIITAFILVLISACGPQSVSQNGEIDVRTIVAVQVEQTQLAATVNALQNTPIIIPSVALATPTITLTPEPSLTPTPEGVVLVVNENTNCRSGPAGYYDFVTMVNAGATVQAVGRNPENNYYYVHNPNAGGFCWLWSKYSSVNGDISTIPVFTPQPTNTPTVTPTLAAGFNASYVELVSCAGQFALTLKISNTGSVTWQSIKVVIVDNTSVTTLTHSLDYFRPYLHTCGLGTVQNDLTPGEYGEVTTVNPGQFLYNPTGHDLTVKVTVYSEDGQAGTSMSKTLNITP